MNTVVAGAVTARWYTPRVADTREIVDRARAGKLAPIYILASDHPVLVDRAVAAIRDAAVEPGWRAFNYDVIEGKPTASRITAAANTLPMMAPRRMVLVRDLAPMAAEEQAGLAAYLEAPSPTTVLVAITTKLDKRLKLYAAAAKKGFLHVLEAPRHPAPWIRDEAKARGVKIAPDAVDRLADAVGNDLSRLALVIDQLSTYAGGETVTADHVEDLVADTRERSVFELTDAIGAGDLPGALAAVGSLCDQRQSALGVIAMLARFVRQIGQLHAARAAGLGKGELAQAVGVPPFVVDKLAAQARRLSPAAVSRAQRVLHDADRALKGQPVEDVQRTEGLTGPAVRALGRQLAERVVLERVVTALVM
jgi:DNA polymerase-3 subunit delta